MVDRRPTDLVALSLCEIANSHTLSEIARFILIVSLSHSIGDTIMNSGAVAHLRIIRGAGENNTIYKTLRPDREAGYYLGRNSKRCDMYV